LLLLLLLPPPAGLAVWFWWSSSTPCNLKGVHMQGLQMHKPPTRHQHCCKPRMQ
jgi:hypothetical protein